jgi:hypothetical protein
MGIVDASMGSLARLVRVIKGNAQRTVHNVATRKYVFGACLIRNYIMGSANARTSGTDRTAASTSGLESQTV